jgi:hypothetical protein
MLLEKFTGGNLNRSSTVRLEGSCPAQSITPKRTEGVVTDSFFAAVTKEGETVVFSFTHCRTHGSPPKNTCDLRFYDHHGRNKRCSNAHLFQLIGISQFDCNNGGARDCEQGIYAKQQYQNYPKPQAIRPRKLLDHFSTGQIFADQMQNVSESFAPLSSTAH